MPPIRHEVVIQRNETQRIPITSWTKIDVPSTNSSSGLISDVEVLSTATSLLSSSSAPQSSSSLTQPEASMLLSNMTLHSTNHTIILHALNSSIANLTENVAKLTQKVSEQNQNQNQITLVYHTNEGDGSGVVDGDDIIKEQTTTIKNDEEHLLILDQTLYEPANAVQLDTGGSGGGVDGEGEQQSKMYNFLTG